MMRALNMEKIHDQNQRYTVIVEKLHQNERNRSNLPSYRRSVVGKNERVPSTSQFYGEADGGNNLRRHNDLPDFNNGGNSNTVREEEDGLGCFVALATVLEEIGRRCHV
jgi:hypothetical protein